MAQLNHSKKKWVLVTGGTRGIGRGILLNLVEQGYYVVFTYQSSIDAAMTIEHQLNQTDDCVKACLCDGKQFECVQALANELLPALGAPYALINNMGMVADALIFNLDTEKCDDVIKTNLSSAFYFNKCFVPSMCEQGNGYVIHMSSISAFKGNPGQTSYAATKAALIGVTRSLALEVGRFNIKVNAIAPGLIETEIMQDMPENIQQKIVKSIPLKRIGKVEDVSHMVQFLISGQADYMTGQTIVIDGGLSV